MNLEQHKYTTYTFTDGSYVMLHLFRNAAFLHPLHTKYEIKLDFVILKVTVTTVLSSYKGISKCKCNTITDETRLVKANLLFPVFRAVCPLHHIMNMTQNWARKRSV